MADLIKVRNITKYAIGLKLINGIERTINPGTITYMSREDIEYNVSIARSLFENPKQLEIDDEELNTQVGLTFAEVEEFTDGEIEKKLKSNANTLRKWITDVNSPHILEKIYHMANDLDLPVSKIKVLKEKMPERYLLDD